MGQAPAFDKIILTAIKLNRPIPKEMQDGPQVFPWLALFYNAFIDLMSDRHSENSLIPWSVRQKWAEVHGLDALATRLLHTHVIAMDMAFLKWRAEHAPRKGKEPPAKPEKDAPT